MTELEALRRVAEAARKWARWTDHRTVDENFDFYSEVSSALEALDALPPPAAAPQPTPDRQQALEALYAVVRDYDRATGRDARWADVIAAIAAWNRRAPSADHIPDAGKMVAPPVVKDCLTTQAAYAAGAAEMRERAAGVADGTTYHGRYRTWPWWANPDGSQGNRENESDVVQHADAIATAIRALPLPAGGSGWRPIETAPRDDEDPQ